MKVKTRLNTNKNTPNKAEVNKMKKNAAVTKAGKFDTPAKKKAISKAVIEKEEEQEEEEEVAEMQEASPKVAVSKKAVMAQKKSPINKKTIVKPEVEVEEESDEDEEDEEKEEAEQMNAEQDDESETEDEEEEEQEQEDEDDDDDDDDDENETAANIEEEAEDNDAPEEAPVKEIAENNKNEKPKHKFHLEAPSESVPEINKVYLKNVSQKTKALMVFHVLKTFGLISNIHKKDEEPITEITVAFVSKNSAISALLFLPSFTLKTVGVLTLTSNVITAEELNELGKKTIVVRNIEASMSVEDVQAHFSDCGSILYASFINTQNPIYLSSKSGYISQKALGFGKTVALIYKTIDGAECAVEKHNSILLNRHIWVTMKETEIKYIAERSIKLNNTNNYTTFSVETLNNIFSDCGEIEYMEVLCNKQFLATITFADAESVNKAMALNNTTVENLLITIHTEVTNTNVTALGAEKTTVYVSNLKPGTGEEELTKLFERVVSGIKTVKMFTTNACIEFDTVDNYCQAFKLDEAMLNGQKIYVEPYSPEKNKRFAGPKRNNNNFGTGQFDTRKRKLSGNDFNSSPKRAFTGPNKNNNTNNGPRKKFPPQGGPDGFKPRNNFQGGQGGPGGFQQRNNSQGGQNGFKPRKNFQGGNQNNFQARNNQQGNGANNFPKKNFQQGNNFYRPNFQQKANNNNSFQDNQGGPRKFNKSPGGPKNARTQNSI